MDNKNRNWENLVAWARRAPAEPDAQPPLGFAARVVALAYEREKIEPLWEMFSLRALGLASLVAIAAVAVHFSGSQTAVYDDIDVVDQAVADLFVP